MKTIVFVILSVIWIPGVFASEKSVSSIPEPGSADFAAEDAPPEWRGMLVVGDQRRFSLSTSGGSKSSWIAVGQSFNDWELIEYDENTELLLVRKGSIDAELGLTKSEIVTDDSSPEKIVAQAESLIRQMNFESMMEKMLEQQRKAMVSSIRQSMAQDPNMQNIDPDEFTAFQEKVMDVMLRELNPEQMGVEMAAAYAEVFTPAEMQGMAEFYATPAGRASLEKAPEIQERLMQSMMPRMMGAMPKIRQMAQEFEAQQRTKRESATPAPGVPEGVSTEP